MIQTVYLSIVLDHTNIKLKIGVEQHGGGHAQLYLSGEMPSLVNLMIDVNHL